MSSKTSSTIRMLWICPAILLASWLAVRTLSASPGGEDLGDPPAPLTSVRQAPEIRDAALARLIARLAETARAERR